jgi:sarcosine oxidase subunit alpha
VPAAHQPRQRLWKIVARQVVLASGAYDRPIVFGGNDLPGVMMASAIRSYVNRFGVGPGKIAVIFTATDDGWITAFDLHAPGTTVRAIVDVRDTVSAALLARARQSNAQIFLASKVLDAQGSRAVQSVTIVGPDDSSHRLDCDLLAVSGGWSPNLALSTHLGIKARWSEQLASLCAESMRGMTIVGAARGSLSLGSPLREGAAAGAQAAQAVGYSAVDPSPADTVEDAVSMAAFWDVGESKG